jgi:hypothetical protein
MAGFNFGAGQSAIGNMLNPATTSGWGATVTPATNAGAGPFDMMGLMKGFQGPQQVAPIMSGGVGGSAPQPQTAGLNSNPLMQAIMSMIGGGGAAGRIPGLGQILRGSLMRV